MEVPALLATAMGKLRLDPTATLPKIKDAGVIDVVSAITLIVNVADFVGSATLVAVSTGDTNELGELGAVYVIVAPEPVITPLVAVHWTCVFVVPVTVAVKSCEALTTRMLAEGEMLMAMLEPPVVVPPVVVPPVVVPPVVVPAVVVPVPPVVVPVVVPAVVVPVVVPAVVVPPVVVPAVVVPLVVPVVVPAVVVPVVVAVPKKPWLFGTTAPPPPPQETKEVAASSAASNMQTALPIDLDNSSIRNPRP
jgi:hypothetical protein